MRAFYRRPPKYISAPDSLIRNMIQIGGKELVHMTNVWGDNALICSIRNKRSTELIKLLLDTGGGKEYVTQCNFKGKTPLHMACEINLPVEVVKALVELGGKELIMMEDDQGVRAESKSVDVMDYLIKVGGDLNKKSTLKRPTVLHDLVQDKLFGKVEGYLNDENVNLYGKRSAMVHQDQNGWTPLMFSVLKNAPDSVIEKMIFIGGSEILTIINKWNNIALLYALAQRRNLQVIKLFVEKGGGEVCVAKSYGKGLTPLHWACKYNASFEVIQFLIEEGSKNFFTRGEQQLVEMKCFYNQVPLHLVCANGPDASLETAKHMIHLCGEILLQVKDIDFKLPLHVACQHKASFEFIKCLVEYSTKESLLLCDSDGKNPLHLACENGASEETLLYLADTGGPQSVNNVPYMIRQSVHRGVLTSYYDE